ncbi:DedA family protein [Pararhodobacter zhoushanensis]|uniref:DedA family protein n=1 Tax=Pararhodobacter zhoushanensis TaxID=2479545 RepID=UPI000F8E2287|nr:VTT domain-containing protein [Pararhodobacter zhoushanensis]
MTLDHLISQYGLWAVFVGCFFEGETAAITGGVFAHRHLLLLWQVTLVAGFAAFLADMSFFLAGRRFRDHRFVRKLAARPRFAVALRGIDRNPARFATVFRFIPGMRMIGPLALAQSTISTARFALLDALAAAVWSVLYAALGHVIGQILAALFGPIERVEVLLIGALIAALAVAAVILWRRHRRG